MRKERQPQKAGKRVENGVFVSFVPCDGKLQKFVDLGAKPPSPKFHLSSSGERLQLLLTQEELQRIQHTKRFFQETSP